MALPLPRFIRLLFVGLAGCAFLFLVSDLLARRSIPRGLWLVGFVSLLLTHALVSLFLESTRKPLEDQTTEHCWPDWVLAQAEKNASRASVVGVTGVVLFLLVEIGGSRGWLDESWTLGLKAFNLAFQVGAWLGESVILNAQLRLVRDVEAWVKKPDELPVGSEV